MLRMFYTTMLSIFIVLATILLLRCSNLNSDNGTTSNFSNDISFKIDNVTYTLIDSEGAVIAK